MSAEDDALRLTGLLASRLCHDLVGPAGAIANGLELCEDAAMVESAMGLMKTTSSELNHRLAFYRRAFGTGSSLTWNEARALSQTFLAGRRHRLSWAVEAEADARPPEEAVLARLAMNMVLCAVDVLPGGGEIVVETANGPRVEALGKQGDQATVTTAFKDAGPLPESLTPRDVQPFWTACLARRSGGRIFLEQGEDDRLVLEFRSVGA
jgi:histidine phosphotransferase ChpT